MGKDYERICEWGNLYDAYLKARRGKRWKNSVAKVEASALEAVALGCPAMGSEVLEDMEFEPMFDGCKSSLKGKRVALFGSYGWGGGEWMHNWERDCRSSGIQLACDSVICNEAPDDAVLAACQALGKALVG